MCKGPVRLLTGVSSDGNQEQQENLRAVLTEPLQTPTGNFQRIRAAEKLCQQLLDIHGLGDWTCRMVDRRTRNMGKCVYRPKRIELSRIYVVRNSLEHVRHTILHEIAHALVGPGHGHGPVWRAKARELGVDPKANCDNVDMPERPAKYMATCPCCGRVYRRRIAPRWNAVYSCPKCGLQHGRLTFKEVVNVIRLGPKTPSRKVTGEGQVFLNGVSLGKAEWEYTKDV